MNILDHVSDGVLSVDKQGVINFVNKSFQQTTGFDQKKLMGQSLSSVTEKHPAESLFGQFSTNFDQPSGYEFFVNLHSKGIQIKVQIAQETDTVWYLITPVTIESLFDNEVFKVIPAQKLLSTGSVVHYIAKAYDDYAALFIGENVSALLGWTAQDFAQNHDLWITSLHPDDHLPTLEVLKKWDHVASFTLQYRFVNKEGEYVWLRDHVEGVLGNDGKPYIVGVWSNIDAEVAQKEREQKLLLQFSDSIESIPFHYIMLDEKFNFLKVNKKYAEAKNKSVVFFRGKNIFELYPDEEDQRLLQTVIDTGSVRYVTKRSFLNPSDSNDIKYFDWVLSPVIDPTGDVVGLNMVANDVTEKKSLISEVDFVKRQYEAIFNSAEYGMGFADFNGQMLNANPALCRLLDYTESELKQLSFMEFTPTEYHEMEAENIQKVLKDTPSVYYEKEFIRKDRSLVPVSLAVFKTTDNSGEVIGVGAIVRDLTSKRLIQKNSKEHEEMLHLLLEATSEAVYGINIKGQVTFCNPSCVAILGYSSPDELIGTNMHDKIHYNYANGDKLVEKDCEIFKAFRNGVSTSVDNEVFWRKDGTCFPVEYYSSPIFKDNQVIGAVVFFTDITERKNSEQKLLNILGQKDTLLKEIHHRVKNNLQIIVGMLQLQIAKEKSVPMQHSLEEMEQRIHTMALLHESIYKSDDFTNINSSQYLSELLQYFQQSHFVQEKNCVIDQNIEYLILNIDQLLPVGLIVNELVSNSLKHAFRPQDNRLITIKFKRQKGNIALLQVNDNGAGFAPSFDSESYETLGFRLVNALVRQLSGEIHCRNVNGAEIVITFPIKEGF